MALSISLDVYELGTGNKLARITRKVLMTSRIRSVSSIPLGYSPDPAQYIYSKISYAEPAVDDLYTGETVTQLTAKINA